MKSCSSDPAPPAGTQRPFCEEPWTGRFSIQTNGDVTFCPCYLQLRIGNLADASMLEIWNSETMLSLRSDFRDGRMPELCREQLCPVAVAHRESAQLQEHRAVAD